MALLTAQDLMSKLMSQVGSESPVLEELFRALGKRRDEASQTAEEAGKSATALREAPAPETNPTKDLLIRALGSVASTFTRSEGPSERARQSIDAEQKQLLLKRASDMSRLDETYDKAIERAQKLQDTETSLRLAKEQGKLSLDRETLNNILKSEVDLEIANMRDVTDRLKIKAAAGDTDDEVQALKEAAVSGQIEFPTIPSKLKGKVLKLAADAGEIILPRKARQTIATMNGARQVLQQLGELNETITRGTGTAGRLREGFKNELAAILQSTGRGEKAAIYRDFKEGILAVFSRAVGDVGTLNEGDIDRARRLTPTLKDSDIVAANKLIMLSEFIDELEKRTIETYAYKMAAQKTGPNAEKKPDLDSVLNKRGY